MPNTTAIPWLASVRLLAAFNTVNRYARGPRALSPLARIDLDGYRRRTDAEKHADGCFAYGASEHCAICGTFIPEEDVPRDLDFEADMAAANSEEPDYEALWQARMEAREAAYLDRMDRSH